MSIEDDIRKAQEQQKEILKSFYGSEATPDLVKRVETDIEKAKKSPIGTIHVNSAGTWKKMTDTGDGHKDWVRVKKGDKDHPETPKTEEKKEEPKKIDWAARTAPEEKPTYDFKVGDKVKLGDDINLVSLSDLKGKTLEVVGEEKTDLISQPTFIKVKLPDGEVKSFSPDYLKKFDEKEEKSKEEKDEFYMKRELISSIDNSEHEKVSELSDRDLKYRLDTLTSISRHTILNASASKMLRSLIQEKQSRYAKSEPKKEEEFKVEVPKEEIVLLNKINALDKEFKAKNIKSDYDYFMTSEGVKAKDKIDELRVKYNDLRVKRFIALLADSKAKPEPKKEEVKPVEEKKEDNSLEEANREFRDRKKSLYKTFAAMSSNQCSIKAAKEVAKKFKIRYQDILKTKTPDNNLEGDKGWDKNGDIK